MCIRLIAQHGKNGSAASLSYLKRQGIVISRSLQWKIAKGELRIGPNTWRRRAKPLSFNDLRAGALGGEPKSLTVNDLRIEKKMKKKLKKGLTFRGSVLYCFLL